VKRVMVRYRVKPERASENVELVRAVYDELHETRPEGLRYATFKLDDGVSFVHLAEHDDEFPNQLTPLASFKRFQEGIAERCDDPPVVSEVSTIGAYRLLSESAGRPQAIDLERRSDLCS
jgi:hypothetical protein